MQDVIKVLNSISPYVRRAWDGNMLQGWQLKERVIFDYEFVYIMDGEAVVTIEEKVYNAGPGELYIFRPGVRHSMKAADCRILRQPHIHFDLYRLEDSEEVKVCYRPMEKIKAEEVKYFRKDVNTGAMVIFPDRVILKNRNAAERLFFQLIREMEQPDGYSPLKSKAIFIELLILILREIYGSDGDGDEFSPLNSEKINTVREYIRLHYNSRLTLDQLARMSNISKSHLLRIFKTICKTSPIQYQTQLKINKAKEMIAGLHNNYSEIAEYLGFLNVQHFSKVFKKHTGLSPSQYREKINELPD